MNLKPILKIAIPAAAAAVTITALGLMLRSREQTISNLRDQLAMASVPVPDNTEEEAESVYKPIEVDHHYDRAGFKIYLIDDLYGQIWLPVLADASMSGHALENMKQTSKGRMLSFDDDGNLNALTGVDLSAHNTVTDWNAVKADGIDFVMLRVGYRTYGIGAGELTPDSRFREYYNAAKNAGLMVGAYFFSQAITEEEAVEEAVFTAQMLEGCELDFPVAFDWELIYHDDEGARTDNVPVDVLTDSVIAFCQNIEAFGYQSMFYQNKRTTLFKLDLPRLQEIPFWLAEYGDGPTYIYDYDMWQYCSDGTVAGIEGDVDINLSFYDYSQEGAPTISLPAPEYTEATAEPGIAIEDNAESDENEAEPET